MPRSVNPNQGRGPVPVSAGNATANPAIAQILQQAGAAGGAGMPQNAAGGMPAGANPNINIGNAAMAVPAQGIQQALQALMSRGGGATSGNGRGQMPSQAASSSPIQTAQNIQPTDERLQSPLR